MEHREIPEHLEKAFQSINEAFPGRYTTEQLIDAIDVLSLFQEIGLRFRDCPTILRTFAVSMEESIQDVTEEVENETRNRH